MKEQPSQIVAALCLGGVLGLMSCGQESSPPVGDTGMVDTEAVDTDTESATDTDTVEEPNDSTTVPPTLAGSHSGWQDADCMACHDYDAHNDALLPGDCAACHGSNGAVQAETVLAHHNLEPENCKCHLPGDAHSPAEDFPAPDSCKACH